MRVHIVGGTGFLGYHIALEQLKRGNEVATLSLPDVNLGDWYPKEIQVEYEDIFKIEEDKLIKLFKGYDALVYAVGPDDRITPDGDAYEFFHERLVVNCGRVVKAARDAGVKKCIILGSYFAYFAKKNPEWNLGEHHPYIRCRLEQEELVIKEGGEVMDVMILELPYIYGVMPEREPLWKEITVRMLYESKKIRYPKGGTAMITAKTVAEAAAGAIERGVNGRCYAIGDVNKTWVELLTIMLKAMDMEDKKILTVPTFIMNMVGKSMRRKQLKEGKDSGLDLSTLFKDIQTRYLYIDADEVKKELDYQGDNVDETILETTLRCIELIKREV